MQKQAPSLARVMVMAGFALSCFGLILFLWLAFGGPIPLQPKGYRVTVSFS
jgi:phospholipid/cholesterol/gamma-HCH transport system substrate-binding protein